jgi:RHS repeat-associated protein
LTVQHYTGPLVEETGYYPFGLVQAGISSKAFGRLENRKKFNGYEENKDFDLNWLESFYRTYDPQLGRFWQVDPKPNHSESPYAAMGNNPISKVYYDSVEQMIITIAECFERRAFIYDEQEMELKEDFDAALIIAKKQPPFRVLAKHIASFVSLDKKILSY